MNTTSARSIAAREHEQQAVEMRRQGMTYRAIAAAMHLSDMAIRKMVKKVIARTIERTNESIGEVKAIEIERLDQLLAAVWDDSMSGDTRSAGIALKIMERRAALLGLDAPKTSKVDVDVSTDIDDQIGRILERFKPSGQVSSPMEVNRSPQPIDASRRLG